MGDRQEVGDLLGATSRTGFTSSTRAVDLYVKPAPEQETRSDALKAALVALDQGLDPVFRKGIRQAAQAEYEEGQAEFEKHRKDFAEAVRSGEIALGASPFVRRGYRESQLQVLGATYNIELERALEHSNLHEVEDPREIEEFIAAFHEKFADSNNLGAMPEKEVARVFAPIARSAQDRFRNAQADRNISFVEEKRIRSFQQEILLAVHNGRFSGPPGSAAAQARNLGEWLQVRSQQLYEEGVDYKVIEKVVSEAVKDAGMANGRVSVAGLLDHITIGEMGAIGASPAGRAAKKAIRAAAAAADAKASRQVEKELEAERKQAVLDLQTQAQAAARDGDYDAALEFTDQLNEIDPTKARAVYSFINTREGIGQDLVEEGAFAVTRAGVSTATSEKEALEIVDEAVMFGRLTPEDASALTGVVKRRFENRNGTDALTLLEGDRFATRQLKALKDRYPEDTYGRPLPENANMYAQAETMATEMAMDWLEQNTDEDGNYDRRAFMGAIGGMIDEAYSSFPSVLDETPDTGTAPPPDWAK